MRQQLEDMKDDLRHTSLPEPGADHMILVSKAVAGSDATEALEYFHSIRPDKWMCLVETRTVPKTILGQHSISFPDPSGAKEPIGNRILELPESYERTLLRDPTSDGVVYAQQGSLAKVRHWCKPEQVDEPSNASPATVRTCTQGRPQSADRRS